MKKIIYFLALPLLFYSCSKSAQLSKAELPVDLAASKSFKSYMSNKNLIETGLLEDRYNLRHVDWSYIRVNTKGLHSMEELYAVYKKAGMENSEEYVNANLRSSLAYHKLLDELPILKTMSGAEVTKVSRKVFFEDMKQHKPEVTTLLETRRKVQAARINKQVIQ